MCAKFRQAVAQLEGYNCGKMKGDLGFLLLPYSRILYPVIRLLIFLKKSPKRLEVNVKIVDNVLKCGVLNSRLYETFLLKIFVPFTLVEQ